MKTSQRQLIRNVLYRRYIARGLNPVSYLALGSHKNQVGVTWHHDLRLLAHKGSEQSRYIPRLVLKCVKSAIQSAICYSLSTPKGRLDSPRNALKQAIPGTRTQYVLFRAPRGFLMSFIHFVFPIWDSLREFFGGISCHS